jgi:glycosyltransferase involved in cell wall biosynthesis
MSRYALITPAHNEEAFIAQTIVSVINQTIRPVKWVIVNDASTDRTQETVERLIRGHDFIELVNVERAAGRHFSNKVRAFNDGMARVGGLDYSYIGNLDADISLARDYYEVIMRQFEDDSKLGIGGGMVYTRVDDEFITYDQTLDSIGGAVQLFRRACFENIGGYIPLPYGGIDAAAEIMARMKGWKVRKFPWLRVLEHRRTGSAEAGPLTARVREGHRLHSLGYSALFYFLRCCFRASEPPFLIGSVAALYGYMDSVLRRRPLLLPEDVVAYLRAEQRQRLKALPAALLGLTP